MGRPSRTRALSVWANGIRVGEWRVPGGGTMEFAYDPAWMTSTVGRPLSLSLPFRTDGGPLRSDAVRNFFENLLPDNEQIRQRIGMRFKTPSLDAFDLLAAIGRDCVGALQILDADAMPHGVDRIDGRHVDADAIERLLIETVSSGRNDTDDDFPEEDGEFRISLAGAQEKTGLLRYQDQWQIPRGSTPTTHILKLPLGLVGNRKINMFHSVENEWLCLRILRAYGLPTTEAEILQFGTRKVLGVERFDRRFAASGTALLRLPQEDFCQVFGLPPHLKYENDGGPGLVKIAQMLRLSSNARQDLHTLLSAQILFWMLAAPDGHAKNFSIRLLAHGAFALTPLYDVMSIWPVEGKHGSQVSWHTTKLAMAVPGNHRRYRMRDIDRSHFDEMARQCFYATNADALIDPIVEQTAAVIDAVSADLPAGFPEQVATAIFNGLQRGADTLAR